MMGDSKQEWIEEVKLMIQDGFDPDSIELARIIYSGVTGNHIRAGLPDVGYVHFFDEIILPECIVAVEAAAANNPEVYSGSLALMAILGRINSFVKLNYQFRRNVGKLYSEMEKIVGE